MCRAGFKNGGLRERPLTENGGGGAFRAAQHGQKGVLELKITKKGTYFLKRGSFRAAKVEKVESLAVAMAENRGLSRSTYPYCPNM